MSAPTNLRGVIDDALSNAETIIRLAGEISYALSGSMPTSRGSDVGRPFGGVVEQACEANLTLQDASTILDGILLMLMPNDAASLQAGSGIRGR